MSIRSWATPRLGLLAVMLLVLPMHGAHAGTEPLPRIYACQDSGLADCRLPTPAFDSCEAWGAWRAQIFTGGPFTFQEIEFNGQFGEHGLQCLVHGASGGLVTRSIDAGACSTPTDTVSGPDVFNRVCTGTGPKPARQLACSKPCVADPVNPAPSVGNMYEIALDYVGTGPFPLKLERYYNSGGTRFFPGSFNQAFAMANWRHSYERSISFMVRQGISFARVDRKDGNSIHFTLVGSTWTPGELDITERLEQAVENTQTIWKFTNLDDEVERYNVQTGRLLSITNRAGLTQNVLFDTANRVASVTDPFGRTLTFNYGAANCDGARCVASVQDPTGNLIQYGYDTVVDAGGNSATRLRTVTYPGTATPRTYNYSFKLLIEIIDENGGSTASWTYDDDARAVLSQRAGGVAEKVTLQYQNASSVQITAAVALTPTPVNRVNTYEYQTIQRVQRLTAITGDLCPSCGPKASQYDTNGYLSQITDWNNNVTTYLRQDATRRDLETQRIEAFGTPQARTITTTWHSTFRLPTLITEPGRTTAMTYDTVGNVLTRTITDTALSKSRTWTYTYNANGQVLTINGPRTDVTDVSTYAYYTNNDPATGKRGNIASITNAAGHVTSITAYNAHGQPLTIIDPNGLTTILAYDARQRLTSRLVGSELTTYTYDNAGQLTRVTMPDGSFLNYTYDPAHRLTQIDDNLGNKIVYTLDAMGNRTLEQVRDPSNALAQTRSRVYSNLNRLSQDIGAQSQTTTYTYDNQGNVKSIDGPLTGIVDKTIFDTYDALNRLTRMTNPQSGQINYGYNARDQMTSVTDPRSLATTYGVDGLGNLNQLVSPDTGTTQHTYDAAGNLLTKKDARNITATYSYDTLNRVTQIVYPAVGAVAAQTVTFAYDQGTNGKGRLTLMTDRSGNTSWAYDQKGRVIRKQQTIIEWAPALQVYTTEYAYNASGQMSSMTYPSGRVVAYTYDATGRVSGITVNGNPIVSGVQYHPFGQPKSWTFGNGQSFTRSFDTDGRIATHKVGTQTRTLNYDAASRITGLTHGDATLNQTIGYDYLDQVTSWIANTTTQSYTYDAVGNRKTQTIGANSYSYSYTVPASSNRLNARTGPPPARTYTYDAAGNRSGDGTNTYSYGGDGRLASVPQFGVTYVYQRPRTTSVENTSRCSVI